MENKETTCTTKQDPNCEFKQLGISDSILRAVEESGYTTPTSIQHQAIPIVLEGKDV